MTTFSARVSFALVLVVSLVFEPLARAQDPLAGLTGLTLDAALNSIADRVDSSIEKAGTVANGVVIRAGSEVWAEIQNLRTAANDVLNKAVKDLNATLTQQLAQVSSDANALERKTAQDAQRVVTLAQGVANTIPFSKTQPQVTSLSPSYAVFDPTAPQGTLLLTIQGNFFDSALSGFAPSLPLGDNKPPLSPIEVTTTHMIFSIPASLFAASPGHAFPLVKLQITVPYKQRGFIFSSRKEAHFTAALIGLSSGCRSRPDKSR
jgi:hypothetical protein